MGRIGGEGSSEKDRRGRSDGKDGIGVRGEEEDGRRKLKRQRGHEGLPGAEVVVG